MLAKFVRAIIALAAVALWAAANPSWALGDPDAAGASEAGKEGHPMSLVPQARTNLFAAVSNASTRRREAEPEDADADRPTDDFGRPLRSCDVPWDYVPRRRK